jgi:ATP-binding cassette subfamily B protein
LALLVEACFHALLPLGAWFLVDHAIAGRNRDSLALMLAGLAGGFVVALIAGVFRDNLAAALQSRSLAGVRHAMFARMQKLSMAFYSATPAEDVLECFAGDLGVVETAFSMAASWGALPALESLIYTGLALWLDWRLGLLTLLLWPWIVLAPRAMTRHVNTASESCRDEEVRVLSVVEESLTAKVVIRAFSLEHLGVALFRKRNELLARGTRRAGFLMALMDRFTDSGILFIQIVILALSALLTFDGEMTVGKLVSIPVLTWLLSQALMHFAEYLPALEEGKLAWKRIQELMKDPAPVLDKPDAKLLGPLRNEILFNGVSFGYGGAPALTEVTARIARGSYVALVGPSGSGKSTMLGLLMRFHDPAAGMVTFDGHDLKAVTQASLRARLGLVLQDNFIFNASMRENIRLGHPDASEERLRDVVRTSGILDLLPDLPSGLDTLVGENGTRISGELTQRLAIARALLRNPDILLLDELASALEPAEEVAIGETLREIARERTVISATHRLSGAADADLIYVLDGGKIVEQGSHFELMALNGFYATLWRKQSGFRFSADGRHVDVDAQRLKQLPVLEKLDEEILAELAPFFTTETFPAGREIVCQDDPGDRFYIIARGQVEVWRTEMRSGEATCMAQLQDGDYFGEITLITGFPRTATVRTSTVCTCISLGRGQFDRLVDRFPEIRRELSDTALRRLLESSQVGMAVVGRQAGAGLVGETPRSGTDAPDYRISRSS